MEVIKHEYRCLACGQKISRAGEALIDIAPLIYNGAAKEIINGNPLLITATYLEQLLVRRTKDGIVVMQLIEALELAYSEYNRSRLDQATAESNADKALEKYREQKDSFLNACILDENEPIAQVGFGESKKSEEDGPRIPGLKKELSAQLIANYPDELCSIRLEIDDFGGCRGRLEGKPGALIVYGRRVCPNKECYAEIVPEAFSSKMITIGLVGVQSVGKTSLIYALCAELVDKRGGILVTASSQEAKVSSELNHYREGRIVAKTDADGRNTSNPAVQLIIDNVSYLINFRDIPGEMFNDQYNAGRFDREAVVNRFPGILQCDTYIICAEQSAVVNDVNNRMKGAFDGFISMLKATGDRNTVPARHAPPMLFCVTQVDNEDLGEATAGSIAYERQEYGKFYNRIPASENRGLNPWRSEYGYVRSLMDADGERRIRSLLDHLSKEIYLTPITCSAYGHAPYKDPPTCGETRAQERVAQEPQKPKSRNLDLIIEWILTIVGIKPAFCLEDEKNEIEYSKIDLSALGCNDYHQDIKTVRGILTVFCNPHPFDRKVYEIDGMRGLEHIIRELYLNREIELRIRKGTVPNGDE